MTDSTAPASSAVYYSGNYWNNRDEVIDYLNRRATGDEKVPWWQHLRTWHGRPFERLLAFNCGNGWVERDLLSRDVARSAIGLDIGDDLLAMARAEAERAGLPIEYRKVDTNTFPFDLEGVDCVVNYAAGHHVAYIDRVFRRLADMLGPDGVFVSWDYTGPHRNQYSAGNWEAILAVHDSLPAHLRRDLVYPHLPTMLATDPTEAIHSELILATLERYFDIVHLRHLGGPIAYEVLTFNDGFFDPSIDATAELRQVIAADEAYTDADPAGRSLFTYVVATPKREPIDPELLAGWTAEEDERERAAAAQGGIYYPPTLIGSLTERVERLERELHPAPPPVPGPIERAGRLADRVARRAGREVRTRIGGATTPKR